MTTALPNGWTISTIELPNERENKFQTLVFSSNCTQVTMVRCSDWSKALSNHNKLVERFRHEEERSHP